MNKLIEKLMKEYEEYLGEKVKERDYLVSQFRIAYLRGERAGLEKAQDILSKN